MSALRKVLVAAFKRVVAIYFRDIEVVGERPLPATRGRVFAANHVNGLVDPVLVLTSAPCLIAPVAKSTLWKIPGLSWLLDAADAVPILRKKDNPTQNVSANDDVFARVAERLATGGNILIFPEGTSHNEPHLVTVKTGAGRMLAAAKARGTTGLTYQAVGLEFEARDTFRSRVLIVYGKARRVDDHDEAGDALARAITAHLRGDLDGLVLEGRTWGERLLIARVAEMFAHEQGDASLATWSALGQRVELAKRALAEGDPALYADVEALVTRYFAMLDEAQTVDAVVARGDAPAPHLLMPTALLVLSAPFALVGVALYALPYQLPRAVARLAGSDHDVRSTYKIGTGLVAFPTWMALLVAVAVALLKGHTEALALVLVVLVTSPFAAILWLDRADRRHARGRRGALRNSKTRSSLQRARSEALSGLARGREKAESAFAATESGT